MSKRAKRRWTNLRVSPTGRTMADVMNRNKKPTGKPIAKSAVETKGRPVPPWLGSIWIGPIRAKRSDSCLICTGPIAVGDIIVFRHTRMQLQHTVVMCLMCAESIDELEMRPPG